MATQLPSSTESPTTILSHIERSALGEIFWSAKKFSRRRGRTFGKEGSLNGSPGNSDDEGSDGKRSSTSGRKVITASVPDVTSASIIAIVSNQPGALLPGGIACPGE